MNCAQVDFYSLHDSRRPRLTRIHVHNFGGTSNVPRYLPSLMLEDPSEYKRLFPPTERGGEAKPSLSSAVEIKRKISSTQTVCGTKDGRDRGGKNANLDGPRHLSCRTLETSWRGEGTEISFAVTKVFSVESQATARY